MTTAERKIVRAFDRNMLILRDGCALIEAYSFRDQSYCLIPECERGAWVAGECSQCNGHGYQDCELGYDHDCKRCDATGYIARPCDLPHVDYPGYFDDMRKQLPLLEVPAP